MVEWIEKLKAERPHLQDYVPLPFIVRLYAPSMYWHVRVDADQVPEQYQGAIVFPNSAIPTYIIVLLDRYEKLLDIVAKSRFGVPMELRQNAEAMIETIPTVASGDDPHNLRLALSFLRIDDKDVAYHAVEPA